MSSIVDLKAQCNMNKAEWEGNAPKSSIKATLHRPKIPSMIGYYCTSISPMLGL